MDRIERIRREIWGENAFSQPFYSGKICTDNFETLILRHTMQAAALRCAQNNETTEETMQRRAKHAEHKKAAKFLYDLYKKAYTDALTEVERELRSPPTEQARKQLRAKKQLYTTILSNWKVPVSSARPTPEECVNNLPEVLHTRSRAERLAFWWKIWSKHVLASQYEEFSFIVDVARLATDDADVDYPTILGIRFVEAAVSFHHQVYAQREHVHRLCCCITDSNIRTSNTKNGMATQGMQYWHEDVAAIHKEMGHSKKFVAMPVMEVKRNIKRKAKSPIRAAPRRQNEHKKKKLV